MAATAFHLHYSHRSKGQDPMGEPHCRLLRILENHTLFTKKNYTLFTKKFLECYWGLETSV